MDIKAVLKGFFAAVIITFAALMLAALLAYFARAADNVVTALIYAVSAAGVTAGSAITAKSCQKRISINCMLVAVLYIVMLIIMSAAVNGAVKLNTRFLLLIPGTLICAFFGAVIGK